MHSFPAHTKIPRAFTLIELLVVISIISLLSSVVLASLNSARDKGRIAAGKQFFMNVYHAEADQAAGLWDFDECSGSVALDRSGLGKNGTLVSGPTYTTDTPSGIGCSLVFNGTQSVSVGRVQDTELAVTWTAWIKTTQIVSSAQQYNAPVIIGTIQGSGTTQDALLVINNGMLGWYDELGASNLVLNSTANVSDGKWHMVAAVRNSSAVSIYVDGTVVASGTTGTNGINSNGLEIAKANWAGPQFIGTIDSVYIYSKGLTARAVGKLYAEGVRTHFLAVR